MTELADRLGIDRFSVVGWSGGGLYAAACATVMGDRLVAAGSVAGAVRAPADATDATYDQLTADSIRVRDLARHDPPAALALGAELDAEWVISLRERPEAVLDGPFPPVDLRHFDEPDWAAAFFAATREGLRQAATGEAWDWAAGLGLWGFDLEDITIEFNLWHGDQHPIETMAGIDDWAARIPRARVTRWSDSGHFVVTDHWADILSTLLP